MKNIIIVDFAISGEGNVLIYVYTLHSLPHAALTYFT